VQSVEPYVEVKKSIDVTKLTLSSDEGVFLGRIHGLRVPWSELNSLTGMPVSTLKVVVDGLVRKGAVTIEMVAKQGSGAKLSKIDLADGKDLTFEQKVRIVELEQIARYGTHYEILDVKRTSTVADIKVAYFKGSKEFHPDAYFRKDLGGFSSRIEKIFVTLKNAYTVLSESAARAAYDKTLTADLSAEEMLDLEKLSVVQKDLDERAEREARHVAREKESRLKRNPMVERMQRGRSFIELAEKAATAKQWDQAANHARLAVEFDPSQKARADALIGLAHADRLQRIVVRLEQHARGAIDNVDVDTELAALDACVDVTVLERAASACFRLKNTKAAFRLAQRATDLDGKAVRAWEIATESAILDGKWALALRAAERWVALAPTSSRAKDQLKSAKSNKS
jgi:curved DNA-binding protein CbpA